MTHPTPLASLTGKEVKMILWDLMRSFDDWGLMRNLLRRAVEGK